MTRIKYIKIDNYLVSKNNFSTRAHDELQYVVIDIKSHCYFLVNASVPRDSTGLNYHVPELAYVAESLSVAKKNSKQLLIDAGVSFNVEARNRKEKIKAKENESQNSSDNPAL